MGKSVGLTKSSLIKKRGTTVDSSTKKTGPRKSVKMGSRTSYRDKKRAATGRKY
jgi:hypothetical protein